MSASDPVQEKPRSRGASIPLTRLYLGLLLIGAGALMLASNAGWIPFHFGIRGRLLLPVLIMVAGLSMVKVRGWLGGLIGVPLVFGLAAVTLFATVHVKRSAPLSVHSLTIEKIPGAQSAKVEVSMGMGRLEIGGGASALAEGTLTSWLLDLDHQSHLEEGVQFVEIDLDPQWPDFVKGNENDLQLNLSEMLPIALTVETGASHVRLDLETVHLTSLEIEAGLAAVDIWLGAKATTCTVKVEGGASSLNLVVPEEVGVRMVAKGGLNAETIRGLKKVERTAYESDGYAKANKKITIELEMGLSRVSLRRRGPSSRTKT